MRRLIQGACCRSSSPNGEWETRRRNESLPSPSRTPAKVSSRRSGTLLPDVSWSGLVLWILCRSFSRLDSIVEGLLWGRLDADSSIAATGDELKRAAFRVLSSCCCASFLERVMGEVLKPGGGHSRECGKARPSLHSRAQLDSGSRCAWPERRRDETTANFVMRFIVSSLDGRT